MPKDINQGRIQVIIDEMRRREVPLNQQAYILATVEKETGGTFDIVREQYNNNPQSYFGRYVHGGWQYHGRGLVQITHDYNYEWATNVLRDAYPEQDVPDLVKHPDYLYGGERELYDSGITPPDPDTLARMHTTILIEGMNSGQFGEPLGNYVNDSQSDYRNARRSVNSRDYATFRPIAQSARAWEQTLNQNPSINVTPYQPPQPSVEQGQQEVTQQTVEQGLPGIVEEQPVEQQQPSFFDEAQRQLQEEFSNTYTEDTTTNSTNEGLSMEEVNNMDIESGIPDDEEIQDYFGGNSMNDSSPFFR